MAEGPWSPLYRVLGRALVMLVDSERPILFTTRRVGAKQPRRVVEHHLCGMQQRFRGLQGLSNTRPPRSPHSVVTHGIITLAHTVVFNHSPRLFGPHTTCGEQYWPLTAHQHH